MLRVPELYVDLIDIIEESRGSWQDMQRKLSHIASGRGMKNDSFEKSCYKLLTAALRDVGNDVVALINRSVDIRACTSLWLESEEFLKTHKINATTLQRFLEIQPRLGYLPLYNLIQLYFIKFDECGGLDTLIEFLCFELEKPNNLIGDLGRLNQYKNIVINRQGFEKIATIADMQNRVLNDLMQEMGINSANEGRFTQLTNGYHYLTKLKKLSPDEDQSILAEVTHTRVAEMAYVKRMLGHSIIETLSKNALEKKIQLPENWLQSILAIAGDPRISRTSTTYQRWWARINPEVIALVKERLSGFDLKLFLEALDDFASTSGDPALERMFPKRKIFLEGLLEQKLIRGTRLFLSRGADGYLRENYQPNELPAYAKVRDRNTSIIYLKLDEAHIVEGSHNRRFWIYEDISENSPPNNYEQSEFFEQNGFSLSSLSNIESTSAPFHTPHIGFWQARIINELHEMGIMVNPELVLDKDDYRQYRHRYGIRQS